MERIVARIGRAHGLRGEVSLDVRTDVPALRLLPGASFQTDPPAAGPLVLESVRRDRDRYLVTIAGVADRTAAEALRGVSLVIDAEASDEADAWYSHELEGLEVRLVSGDVIGTVAGLDHAPAHDLLLIDETGGERVLLPFVAALVPVVDLAGGYIAIDPPGGLFAAVPGDE